VHCEFLNTANNTFSYIQTDKCPLECLYFAFYYCIDEQKMNAATGTDTATRRFKGKWKTVVHT